MLKRLNIEQFVIIDKLDLDFKPGLTVLTGETGAGKSILLDAMGLILGDPPLREAVRQGVDEARVEARFMPRQNHPVWGFLAENGLAAAPGQEIAIHRAFERGKSDDTEEMLKNRKDEILLNGKPVELDLLKKVGTFLVEIHGQFANQSLLDPMNQLTMLDLFGDYPPEILKNVRETLRDVHRYTKELDEERVFVARHAHEQMEIERVVEQLKNLGMRENFFQEVKNEHARLLIAKDTSEVFQSVLANLVASGGAEQALIRSNHILNSQDNLDKERLADLYKLLASALEQTRAAIDEMTRLSPDYDIDTKPLYQYEEAVTLMREIAEEHDIPPEELDKFYADMSVKLDRIKNGRKRVSELDELLEKAKSDYRKHAHILSEARVKAGKALSDAISAEMPPLKLLRAQFVVKVEEKPANPWTELGFDEVTFTARMNPGMPFSPIADTASGGELARLILALKVVLQRVQTVSTLVFDEVDTGIGGSAAAAVGERIARLADNTQVLVITHSPQVASRGDNHLHVSKVTDGVTTTTVVKTLPQDDRIEEISRMLAGEVLTTESHAAARSLVDEASKAAKSRRQGQTENSAA